ncbi:hypothetical protein K435DRAFT_655830 [Dendrothele bispora CBS 962.96]|uniref:Cyclin-like domain-containing protein n=1 Tax=Dendrothele bispora (strain CBS 962.96) TaxID=1314807 RepID=A0A4S8MFL3_DENBC|nr:hypothetical protein K435DRAFT_655830 [Dendrothele bispora CBS 962.96]
MATDFWASSHYKRWIVDRATLAQAREEDLTYAGSQEILDFLGIYFANIISKLGKKLNLRQRVIATATVFFRRFYLKNSYCETDPFLVIAACCYVAAKAEESPVHIKTVVQEARHVFGQDQYNVKNFPSDNTKLAEMEFYLVDDLECDLTVFHPYRTLLALCKKETLQFGVGGDLLDAGDLGVGMGPDDGPRYWGTGEGRLELSENALQMAWFIINDSYRSNLCLLYPPHLIAIAAIYLTLVLNPSAQATINHLLPSSSANNAAESSPHSTEEPGTVVASSSHFQSNAHANTTPRRSSRQSSQTQTPTQSSQAQDPTSSLEKQDPIEFLANLNVSLSLISTISQELISLYTLWDRYREEGVVTSTTGANNNASTSDGGSTLSGSSGSHGSRGGGGNRSPMDSLAGSGQGAGNEGSPGFPGVGGVVGLAGGGLEGKIVTPAFLSRVLLRMREARLLGGGNTGPAVNRMVENVKGI